MIDSANGQATPVSFGLSTRKILDDAMADLRCREGTVLNNIGFFQAKDDQHRCRDRDSLAAISEWAKKTRIDAVIWTDLQSNFAKECGKPFSVANAVAHLQGLNPEGKVKAAEYIWRAPPFVKTALRSELEVSPWFAQKK